MRNTHTLTSRQKGDRTIKWRKNGENKVTGHYEDLTISVLKGCAKTKRYQQSDPAETCEHPADQYQS